MIEEVIEVIELKVEAHGKCINGDEIEAIQEIFFRALDNKNVEKTDPARHLIFLEANKEVLNVQDKYKIAVKDKYKIAVKDK